MTIMWLRNPVTRMWERRQAFAGVLLLLLVLTMLVACGGGEDEAATPTADPNVSSLPDNQLRLVCNDSCAERAQCGIALDGSQVVFLRRDLPAVSDHDLAIPAGSIGTVLETRAEQVMETATGNQFTSTFFKLLLSDQITQAWVAEWCVGR